MPTKPPSENSARRFLAPVLVFAAAAAITVASWYSVYEVVARELALQFENQTRQITSLIQGRMDRYSDVLSGAQGLFAASQSVEPNEWSAYVGQLGLSENYSGISAMSYIARVPDAASSTYPIKIYPTTSKSDYYVVTYSVSAATSSAAIAAANAAMASSTTATSALGFDVSSEDKRRTTLLSAAARGQPVTTPVVLAITNNLPSFSIYAPVYRNGAPTGTSDDRLASLQGFVTAGFRVHDLFQGLTSDPIFTPDVDLEIYDAPDLAQVSTSTLLYDTNDTTFQALSAGGKALSRTANVMVPGRIWTLYYTAEAGYGISPLESAIPALIFAAGMLFSFLLAWLIYSLASSREKALALAKKITQDLEASEEKYRLIFETLQDVFYRTDMTGAITIVSPSIERYTGIAADKLIGRNAVEFYPIKEEREKMLAKLVAEGSVSDYPLTLYGKDQKPVNVSLNARVLKGADGKPAAIEGLLRDVTERARAEGELKTRTAELERVNALMVNRELKMAELKKENARLGGEPPSAPKSNG